MVNKIFNIKEVNAFERLYKICPELNFLTHVRLAEYGNCYVCKHNFGSVQENGLFINFSNYNTCELNEPATFVKKVFKAIRKLPKIISIEDEQESFLDFLDSA